MYGPRGDEGAVGADVGAGDVGAVMGVGSALHAGSRWVFLFLVCFFSLIGDCGLLIPLSCAFVIRGCVAFGCDVRWFTSSGWEACVLAVLFFRVRTVFFGQVCVSMLSDGVETLEGSCVVGLLVEALVFLGAGVLVGLLGGALLCKLSRFLARSDSRWASCMCLIRTLGSDDCHPRVLCWFA